jgi:hypothetical protein
MLKTHVTMAQEHRGVCTDEHENVPLHDHRMAETDAQRCSSTCAAFRVELLTIRHAPNPRMACLLSVQAGTPAGAAATCKTPASENPPRTHSQCWSHGAPGVQLAEAVWLHDTDTTQRASHMYATSQQRQMTQEHAQRRSVTAAPDQAPPSSEAIEAEPQVCAQVRKHWYLGTGMI